MNKLFVSLLLTLGISGLAHAAGDAAAGQGKIAMCSACHNADGNSMVPNFPKLAGHGERYLLKQMHDIKSGARPVVEMTGMLDAMTEQDLADIAAWYASQKGTIGAADPARPWVRRVTASGVPRMHRPARLLAPRFAPARVPDVRAPFLHPTTR